MRTPSTPRRIIIRARRDDGSAAVEYVGLALVISMVTAAVASAVDSALGHHLARTLLEHLMRGISGPPVTPARHR